MPNSIAPAQLSGGGQAAPAGNGKLQSGAAAPGGNATPAGSPSTPSSDDAIVAAKKQAEHWRQKYERDVAPLKESVAHLQSKLEGLATGVSMNGQPQAKPPAKTFQDLDDAGIDEIVKKGVEDQNPGFITESFREIARRVGEKVKKEAIESARGELAGTLSEQRIYARVSSEFGADAMNPDSDLRQIADARIAECARADPDWMRKDPERLYDIFARADRQIRASEKGEFERLRTQEASRLAREEIERSNQVIATRAKNDVQELLKKGDLKGAIRERLPWARER